MHAVLIELHHAIRQNPIWPHWVWVILVLSVLHECYMYLYSRSSDPRLIISYTRPKPVEHGYVLSMAVGTIGEWLKLVPFFC